MIKRKLALVACIGLHIFIVSAQQKRIVPSKVIKPVNSDSLIIPVSKADLGTFPYFKTLPNFYANDSLNLDHNRIYFFDGKKYFTVDGKVSAQSLTIKNSDEKIISEFECIREFDKIIETLGGIKIYAGKLPEEQLKKFSGTDIVSLGSKSQMVPSAFYGVVEYVVKTPEKEVWIQLQPYSLGSKFYTLLVVEKITPLLTLNTNKYNQLLNDLETNKTSIVYLSFEPDTINLLPESKDEILSIVGIFQAHPDWKLKLEFHNAPVGKPAYTLALTGKRANGIHQQLVNLGVKKSSIETTGMGDQKPLVTNDTEQGRFTNTRVEITLH